MTFRSSLVPRSALIFLFAMSLIACGGGKGPGNTDADGSGLTGAGGANGSHALPAKTEFLPGGSCDRPENKDKPACQIVIRSFSGTLKFGTSILSGVTKNTYDANGKLKAATTYPNNTATNAIAEILYSYDAEGRPFVTTMRGDLQPQGGDGVLDTQTEITNDYFPDGKYKGMATIISDIPNQPNTPDLLITDGRVYEPNGNKNQIYIMTAYMFSNAQAGHRADVELQFTNDAGAPLTVCKLLDNGKRGEEIVNTLTDDKATKSVLTVYDCASQTANPAGKCIDPNKSGDFAWLPGLKAQAVQTTTWTYDKEGRVARMEVNIDGDLAAPNGSKPVDNSADDQWWCDFGYDANPSGSVMAAFPKDFEYFGLTAKDKLRSVDCGSKGDVIGGNLRFDDWAYVWQTTPGMTEPQ